MTALLKRFCFPALLALMAGILAACSSIQTWSADRQFKAGECQDAVEEYEYRFEKKPSLKNSEKVMLRYHKARRCAADQVTGKALEKLESGHPTSAYFALQKSLRFTDADKKYREASGKIEAQRQIVWTMLDDAASLATDGSFDEAAAKIRNAKKRDLEFADDEDQGLRRLKRAAKGFVAGAKDLAGRGMYLEAESALLISEKLFPDFKPTREAFADLYSEFARDHISNGRLGHALLVCVRAAQTVEDEGLRGLESEVIAALAGEMRQRFVVRAAEKTGRPYVNKIAGRLEEKSNSLFSVNSTARIPIWTFNLAEATQRSDYFEKPENLTKKYRSGYKSVRNPDYDRAADRLSDARREELRYERKLSRLSENQSREMERAQKDRRRIAGDMPKDPNQQESWRRRLSSAEDKVARLRKEHSRERRGIERELQRRRHRVIERERKLNKTSSTRQDPVYSYWSYQRLHKTQSVSTILYLGLAAPKPATDSYAGEVHGEWKSTDYSIIGHNRRLGIDPKKARLDSRKVVREHSEANAVNKAASWFLQTANKLLAKSYEDKWKDAAGDERVELYVKYALLKESKKRTAANLPYDVNEKDIPTLP
jgi:hypothetical protein